MQTFDLEEVRRFSTGLAARLSQCQNGEGFECADLDQALQYHAYLCRQYLETVRAWMRKVFAGRLALDAEVEREFREAGARLLLQAQTQLALGTESEKRCLELYGVRDLKIAAPELAAFLANWVTPKVSVGPSPRLNDSWPSDAVDAARRKAAQLIASARKESPRD